MQREMPYLGVRLVTSFEGMLGVRNELLNELHGWVQRNDVVPAGPYFLQLHVVNMSGPLDVEVGVDTSLGLSGHERVRPAVLPPVAMPRWPIANMTDARTGP